MSAPEGGSPGIERLLVRLPNWLGDVLLARPLLHGLRRALGTAEIVTVGPEPLLGLLGAEPALGRSEPWPRDQAGRGALVERLKKWRASAALVLPPSFSSALFAWRTRASLRLGYSHEWRDPLLTHALRRPPRGDRHLSDEFLELGRRLGAEPVAMPTLQLPARAHEAAHALLEGAGTARAPYALLGPGAIYGPAKRWGEDRFAALGRAFAARGLGVFVCGAAAERDVCESVARAVGGGARSLAGATDLLAQAALCAHASISVCNDSGLAHLSAAVGSPTVVIFGSTSSAWTAPLGPRVRVVQHAPVCAPCFQRTCRIGYRCLTAVEVEEVARVSLEVAA